MDAQRHGEVNLSNTVEPVAMIDFVHALRAELKAAQLDADPELPIEVGPVTVEFTVLTRQEGEGKAGLRFWVVDAGISGKLATESTQKVTMQLTPLAPSGRPARIRDVEPSGSTQPRDADRG